MSPETFDEACVRDSREGRLRRGLPPKITDAATYRRLGYLIQRAETKAADHPDGGADDQAA